MLSNIGKVRLHFSEGVEARYEQCHRCRRADAHYRPVEWSGGKRAAGQRDGPGERVASQRIAQGRGVEQVERVEHGGEEKQKLHRKRHDVAKVAVLHAEGGEHAAQPQCGGGDDAHAEGQRERKPHKINGKFRKKEATADQHPDEHGQCDTKIEPGHEYAGAGDDEPGEVNFLDDVGVFDHAVGRAGEAGGEKIPEQQPAEVEDGRRCPVGRHAEAPVEKQGEGRHQQQGLEQHPEETEGGLLVLHLDVAPGEEVEEFAVPPEFAGIEGDSGGGGDGVFHEGAGEKVYKIM